MIINKQLKDVSPAIATEPQTDLGYCSCCHTWRPTTEYKEDYGHHNGWEMPAYTELLCPDCEDGGCVDNFGMSGERNAEWVTWFHNSCKEHNTNTY